MDPKWDHVSTTTFQHIYIQPFLICGWIFFSFLFPFSHQWSIFIHLINPCIYLIHIGQIAAHDKSSFFQWVTLTREISGGSWALFCTKFNLQWLIIIIIFNYCKGYCEKKGESNKTNEYNKIMSPISSKHYVPTTIRKIK